MNFERKCSVMGRKMKFGCLVKKGVAEVRERDLPEVGPYDVLLHMKVCNICTTDYGQWLGLREHQGYPMAGGHEAAGIVEQVGEKVTDLKVGDMVATGYEGCGHCPACREGHIDQCEEIRNDTEDGYKWGFFGFSNYCVKNSSGVYKVANDLNPSEAGFMEPLATVIHGAKKLRLKPFETVVVIGAGTMGLINAQTAKAYGCRVIVSEMIPKKIETAKAMGFEVIDCNESDPVEKVKELTEGIGADAVIVAVGATSANSQGLETVSYTHLYTGNQGSSPSFIRHDDRGDHMHYGEIKKCDIANGPGVRVSLFVSGCRNHCPGCFNKETWDFCYGKPFTTETKDHIMELLKPDYIEGFSLLGGEPFEPENQEELVRLLKEIKENYPKKNIWCYTGYTYDKDLLEGGKVYTQFTEEMLSYIDTLVDGQFIESQKDITLKFRGSANQRILDLNEK